MFEGIGSVLGAGLGQVGDALSAPRRALWSALGGPESGSELVSKLTGMDPESGWTKALGLGAEVLGDPLTYAGGLLGKLGGAAARAAGFVGDAAGAAAKAAPIAAEAAGEAASPVAKMLGLRRGFGVVKDAMPVSEFNPAAVTGSPRWVQAGDWIGKSGGGPLPTGNLFEQAAAQHADQGLMGAYHRVTNRVTGEAQPGFILSRAGYAGPDTIRHEIVHGMMDQAAKTGDLSKLPTSMRPAAWLKQQQSPLLQGLGQFADEATAQSLGQRGLGNQLKALAGFTLNPHPGYIGEVSEFSPAAAKLVDYGPLTAAGVLGGAGVGTAAGGMMGAFGN